MITSLITMSLPRVADSRRHVEAIIAGALAAADPARVVTDAAQQVLGAFPEGPLALLALGKASLKMSSALPEALWSRVAHALVIVPSGAAPAANEALRGRAEVLESDHPWPTERSVAAGKAALLLAQRCRREKWPLIVLLSGGASAMAVAPEPGLTADDLARAARAVMKSGASIDELNCIRRHCDLLKGGRLAAAAAPLPVIALIISDAIGDALECIGSGPTAPDPTTYQEALAIVKRRKLGRSIGAVGSHLRSAIATGAPDTPKPGDPAFARVTNRIVMNNLHAVQGASAAASKLGFRVVDAVSNLAGESRDMAFALAAVARRARSGSAGPPVAVIWGGETTVTVRGRGRGGRNLEAALSAAITIDGDDSLVVATFATDGLDGTADAAGAIVDGRTASLARRGGADPELALAANDSFGFFLKAGGLLRPGATGTNVNDVWVGLAY